MIVSFREIVLVSVSTFDRVHVVRVKPPTDTLIVNETHT
jgi:hypothetical protein